MFLQGVVFDPSSAASPDGSTVSVNAGRANEALVAELHGKYFTQNYRGNVYIGSTSTAGVVINIASTTVPTYTIWNPSGSGKLCVPIVTLINWNVTTAVFGGLVWMATTAAGSAFGATSPFTNFAAPATPISANLGAGKVSVMKFGNQATTIAITAAATVYRGLGVTSITGAVTVVTAPFILRDDWDGTAVIPPGSAIHLMGTTAVAMTAFVSTVWAEVPL